MGKLLESKTFLDYLKLQGKHKLVTVDCDDSVKKAIKLMMENKYSQLPVIKKEKVVGVISYESVTNTLFNFLDNKKKDNPSAFRVEDLMEEAPFFKSEDGMLDLLDRLAKLSFVLVRNGEKVTDIITSYDALKYFRECGEDFLILNDVEIILRKIIAEKFNASDFGESAEKVFTFKMKQQKALKPPKTVNDLEFAGYITFISSNWDKFNDIFGNKKDFIINMEKVRIIRNKLCHFNNSLVNSDRDYLTTILNWLENKVK